MHHVYSSISIMASFAWVFVKFLFLRIFVYGVRRRVNHDCIVLCAAVLLSSFGQSTCSPQIGANATVKLQTSFRGKDELFSVIGSYAKVGSKGVEAEGTLYQMPSDECGSGDGDVMKKTPEDWVALFHYPALVNNAETSTINDSQCGGVMDRMRNVVMFGASAILILVMNPKIVKELDVPQMISQPIILIQTATNVSAIMEALLRHLVLKVKVAARLMDDPQTVTVWSICWRSRPGSGVVCRSDTALSKEDPGHFWNYFYSLLATLILLMILKNKSRMDEDYDPLDQGQVLRQMAMQALTVMAIKRFQQPGQLPSGTKCNSDICAICLENFHARQRLRVLPCSHEFHTKCVDPWLLRQATCPLCKQNILDM